MNLLKKYIFYNSKNKKQPNIILFFFILFILSITYLALNNHNRDCEISFSSKFYIFNIGYIVSKAKIINDEKIKFKDNIHSFTCSNNELSIQPDDSNSNFNFTGKGKNTLFGKIYSNDEKRMGLSVNFKNPYIYTLNILLICLFISFFLSLSKIINHNYILLTSLLLTFVSYLIEYKYFLNGSSPSIFRIIQFTALLSWILLKSNCLNFLFKFKKIFIIFFIFVVLWFYHQDHILSMHPAFGRHFFFLLNSMIQDYSLSLGDIAVNGLFYDALVFEGKGFMPPNTGGVLFSLFFGSELYKLGFLLLSFVIVSNYYSIYQSIYPSKILKKNENVFISLIIFVLLPLVILSGTFYTASNFGAGLFVSFALKEIAVNKNISIKTNTLLLIATLFRFEVILIFFLLLVTHYKYFMRIIPFFLLSITLFLLSNYIKFNDLFQSGIGFNHNINNPDFKPSSFKFLLNNHFGDSNLKGFFFKLPDLTNNIKNLYLNFPYTGSEPGGYFLIKYLPILLGFFIFIKQPIFYLKSNFNIFNIFIGLSGFILISFYLVSFNTSPKYDILFAPLLIIFFLNYSINKIFEKPLIIILFWIHLSILLNLINQYPFYK